MNFIDLPDPAWCYSLTIPKKNLEWITANQRLFWRVRSTRTKAWRTTTATIARTSGIPRMERAWIVAELSFGDSRRRDPNNWNPTVKACVDGLVDAGMFPDDDHKHITGPDLRFGDVVKRGSEYVRLLIYPTEGKTWSR